MRTQRRAVVLPTSNLPTPIAADGWNIAGTIADSLAGLGAIGALVIAALVYRAQAKDQRSSQASHVITYVHESVDDSSTCATWAVHNYSHLPIYDVTFCADSPPIDETDPALLQNGRVVVPVIETRSDGKTLKGGTWPKEEFRYRTAVTHGSIVTFRDAAGHRWERRSTGELRQIR